MLPKRVQELLEAKRSAMIVERVERAGALQEWRGALGGDDPRKRLAWLLDYAYGEDPAQMPPAALPGLRYALLLLVHDATGGRWAVLPAEREAYDRISPRDSRAKWAKLPKSMQHDLEISRELGDDSFSVQRSRETVPPEELQAAQRVVREALEALVGGRQYTPTFSALPHRYARLGPAEIPSPPIPRKRFVVVNLIIVALPDAVLQAALDLFGQVPPTVVRQCQPDQQQFKITCGRIFIGERRQKYCAAHRDVVRQAQVQAALERFHKKPVKRKAPRRKGGSSR